jgi:imidazolonepropionase-like amidohydrolase
MSRIEIKKLTFLWLLICGLGLSAGLKAGEETIALKGGRVFTAGGGVIDGATVLIERGKIAAVAKNLAVPKGARIIDASAYSIFPGFIDSFTNLGAAEIETIGRDYDEATSPLTPQLRIIDSLNPQNEFISSARKMGITTALSAPGTGNLLSGQSAVIHLAGETATEMVIRFPAAVHASLGEEPKMRYGKRQAQPMTRMGEAALLRQTLVDAQEYLGQLQSYEKKLAKPEEKPAKPEASFMLQSLLPIIRGELPLIILANRLDDILTALRIAEEFKLKIILNGGSDAYKIKDRLAAGKIPVLLRPQAAYKLTVETGNALFENAALLQKAGVKIAFQTGSINHLGDLLAEARQAIEYGLPWQEALKALTINAAEILGVADQTGSIEKGKSADLVVFEGNPLTSAAKLKAVIIGGQVVENRLK